MSEVAGKAEKVAQHGTPDEDTTTVRAYWTDTGKIRDIKRKLGLQRQEQVVRKLVECFEIHGDGKKEEKADGVHSS